MTSSLILIVALLLSGCLGTDRNVKLPNVYSQFFLSLDTSTVSSIREQVQLRTDPVHGPIAIANYFPGKNVLIAVYSGDGFMRIWDVVNEEILFEKDLGITSSIGIGMDSLGDLVMGPVQHMIRENGYGELYDYVGGITVWNTETGNLVECVAYPCEEIVATEQWQRRLVLGASLDPKGHWVLVNNELMIGISDLTGVRAPYAFSVQNFDGSYREIALFAFDPSDNRYAIAFRDGEVLIVKLGEKLGLFSRRIFLGTYEKNSRHKVTAMSFSHDGKWLARIQDGNLAIWTVTTWGSKLQFEHSIPDGRLLTFDQSSGLLFVGTTEKIEVWDVRKMSLIKEFATPKITSLSISSDIRLLIWGDREGTIHVWGVLTK